MGVGAAQLFAVMRGEIDDSDAAARPGDAGGLAQHGGGVLRIMQHLVDQHRVEAATRERQRQKIALDQINAVRGQALKPGARQPQHFGALVEAGDMAGTRGEEFRHAPGAGADIEQSAKRALSQRPCERFFHRCVGRVQHPQRVPLSGMARKIGGGAGCARGADRGEVAAIFGAAGRKGGIAVLSDAKQPRGRRAQRRRAVLTDRASEEHPTAFFAPLCQARIAKNPDVPGNARLALAENLGQFPDREFHMGKQAHDPEAGRIGEGAQEGVDPHGIHIKNSLYVCKTRIYRGIANVEEQICHIWKAGLQMQSRDLRYWELDPRHCFARGFA